MTPCSKCLGNWCDYACRCECHDKIKHDCIRCGNQGVFLVKFRDKPRGLLNWVKTWLCIECEDEFKTPELPYMKCPCDFCEAVRTEYVHT